MKTLFTSLFFAFLSFSCFAQLDTAVVRTIGGERFEEAIDMVQADDGGYLVLGSSGSLEGYNSEVYLLKLTQDLEYEWSKRFGNSGLEKAQAFEQTADGDLVITGYALEQGQGTGYDILLMKVTQEGELLWSTTYGESDWDFGYEITQHSDGGFLVVGETWSIGSGMNDTYLLKFDSEGSFEWQQTYGVSGEDFGTDIIPSQEGDGYLITGASEVDNGNGNYFLQGKIYKVDQQGNMLWELTNSEDSVSVINAIAYQGGDYICSGYTIDTVEEGKQMTTQFLTVDGDLNSTVIYTSLGNQELVDVIHIPSEATILYVGTSDTFGNGGLGVYGFRVSDSSNSVLGSRVWGGAEDEVGRGVYVDDQNAALFFGWSDSYGLGSSDVYIVKIEDPLMVSDYAIDQAHYVDENIGVEVFEPSLTSVEVFPNPTTGILNFDFPNYQIAEIAVMGSSGQLVERLEVAGDTYTIDLSRHRSGCYILHLFDQQGRMLGMERVLKK